MTYYGGVELARVYDDAEAEGFGLVASNVAEPNVAIDTPLVLHGTSGVQPDQLRAMLENGVCKVTKDTRYQYEYARTAFDHYRAHADEIVPPEGVADARDTFFNDVAWSPTKSVFDPRVVSREVRERIAEVYGDLATAAGCAGRSRYT